MVDYQSLITKYEGYVPGERRSSESDCESKRRQRIAVYRNYVNIVADGLRLKGFQKDELLHIVSTVQLKRLYSGSDYRVVIVALGMALKMESDFNARPGKYSLCNDLGVDDHVIMMVLIRYCKLLKLRVPLRFNKG